MGETPRDGVILASAVTSQDKPVEKRAIIYQAGLSIVAPDILAAQRAVQTRAEQAGGYLQELKGTAIIVRVPAAKFEEVMSAIEQLGEVTGRHVQANDVTEEMRDLAIRLENAQNVRKRLEALVERSEKMEDTIKLEQELERVTQTIELLKGKIQYMQSQVAMSTIRAEFNSPLAQKQAVMNLPFAWVRDLGDGVTAGMTAASPDTSRWKRNERFALPAGFVRYFERDYVTEAMNGEEVVIKLKRQTNYDGGEVGFWRDLSRKILVENRAIAISQEREVKLKDGTVARVLIGVKDRGASKQGYLLGIAATPRYVYTFEAWGEKEKFEKAASAVEEAFKTLDVKKF